MNFIAKKKKQLSSTPGFKERKCLEAGGGDNGISATPVRKTSGFRWVDMTQQGEGAGPGTVNLCRSSRVWGPEEVGGFLGQTTAME